MLAGLISSVLAAATNAATEAPDAGLTKSAIVSG